MTNPSLQASAPVPPRHPGVAYGAFLCWSVIGLWLASRGAAGAGATTVGNLVAVLLLLRGQTRAVLVSSLAVLAFSAATEVIATSGLSVFHYSVGHVPAYVPIGHTAIYLAALAGARSPLGHSRWGFALAASLLACTMGVGLVSGRPDLLGWMWLATWALAFALVPVARPLLVALVPAVSILEWVGVGLHLWEWSATTSLGWVSAGNPPSASAMGYAFFALVGIATIYLVAGRGGTGRAAVHAQLGFTP